ncbi:zinc finger, MYND-type containing 12 [Columba livia]|uniref:Zinc finger, MYND-type containing 12 n=1 Tax=Columba livia TaxID=8932 RepID=A0A2I0LLN3_COLLI|nr:zinc finger, MYND-type containing 12 [Columba livia]
MWPPAQPRSLFWLASTKKPSRPLSTRCVSAAPCSAPVPRSWSRLICSWPRPPLSRLQRGLGQLRVAEGNLQQALHHLASDVYLASSTFGLKSLEAAMGYFHMANVFFRQNKMDIANSLYAKVTALWCDRLLSAVQAHERVLRSRSDTSPFAEDEDVAEQQLTEAQRVEGTRVLSAVLEIRSQAPKPELGEMARVLHGLAMLHYLGLDLPAAGKMGLKALELVKQLPQQESLEPIARLLRLINSAPSHAK